MATFGSPLDEYRRCSHAGCEWRVWRSPLCTEHGGKGSGAEFRSDIYGATLWRRGYAGPIVPALRKGE
jgi:hypothetical protein